MRRGPPGRPAQQAGLRPRVFHPLSPKKEIDMMSRCLLPGASRRSLLLGALSLATALALGVGQGHAADRLRVGVMSGSEEEILEVVKEVAARDGLEREVVAFRDYVLPNEALNAGEPDAKHSQPVPSLPNPITNPSPHILPVG